MNRVLHHLFCAKIGLGRLSYDVPRCSRNVCSFVRFSDRVFMSEEVHHTIESKQPIVALESTIITHGMPYPHNLDCALDVESVIRKHGSLPSTIGVLNGNVYIGLQQDQLETLAKQAQEGKVLKVARGDLPAVMSMNMSAGTTVSATSFLANRVGIRTFVTGGIGGVHQGAHKTMDISADLIELGRTPITVISAGIKSILDIGKTLEVLETQGVGVIVFDENCETPAIGKIKFPAFFTADSGHTVVFGTKKTSEIASLMRARDELDSGSGLLVAVPNVSEEGEQHEKTIQQALNIAQEELVKNGIKGKHVTPFLLARVNQLTGGESLKLNRLLIERNAQVGARVSIDYSKACQPEPSIANHKSGSTTSKPPSPSPQPDRLESLPVVIGGSIFDTIVKNQDSNYLKLDGSAFPAKLYFTPGGVARNIADALERLGQTCLLITAVGKDIQGQIIVDKHPSKLKNAIRELESIPTSTSNVIIDRDGECKLLLLNLMTHEYIDQQWVARFEPAIIKSPIVIVDLNTPISTMNYVNRLCADHRIPIWIEPTDQYLVSKIFECDHLEAIKFISPNFAELVRMHSIVFGNNLDLATLSTYQREDIVRVSQDFSLALMDKFGSIHSILTTIGKHGIVYTSREQDVNKRIDLAPNCKLFDIHNAGKIESHVLDPMPIDSLANVSGAGDCMVAAIVSGLLHRLTIKQSLEFGLKVARVSVQANETVPVQISTVPRPSN